MGSGHWFADVLHSVSFALHSNVLRAEADETPMNAIAAIAAMATRPFVFVILI